MDEVPTLGALLERASEEHGHRPFVTFRGETLTYSEAHIEADRHAAGFSSIGLGHGDRIAICMANGLTLLLAWLGLSRLGAIEVPLNPAFKAQQLTHALRTADARVLIVDGETLAIVNELGPDAQLDTIVVGGESAKVQKNGTRVVALSEILRAPPLLPDLRPVRGNDLVAILQTSGTTGLPKGVLLCHRHEVVLGRNIAADMELTSSDVFYNFFPLFHNTGQGIITVACIHAGAHMVLTNRFSVNRFWSDVAAHGCTAFYYMGSMLKLLLEQAEEDTPATENSLRVGWGIAASDADLEAFSERFGVVLRGGYGSTEANIPVFFPRQGRKAGSIGRVIPGWRVEVVDEADAIVPPGTHGELVVRPDEPFTIMQGYANDPAETVAAWRNLWFHTGDGGYKDEDGNLFFGDRIKDVIRRRGETISSVEIEQVVLGVPGVLECAAVPVPAEHGEDEVKVILVGETKRPSYEEIIAHCNAHLPSFAVPRYFEWTPVLPKTETGKTKKQELRKTPFNPITWDRVTGETIAGR